MMYRDDRQVQVTKHTYKEWIETEYKDLGQMYLIDSIKLIFDCIKENKKELMKLDIIPDLCSDEDLPHYNVWILSMKKSIVFRVYV